MSDPSAAYSASGGPTGVLLLHGYTGSPCSVRPLADALVRAGYGVEVPLLPGHGTTPEALEAMRYADWLEAAELAYASLTASCERVLVAGLSMGGTLALELALGHREVAGLILVNPYADPPASSFVELLRPAALASGTRSLPSIGSDILKKGVQSGGYRATPVAPLLSLVEAIAALAPRLSGVHCPVLLFSSRVDHVVPPSSGDLVAREVSGPIERIFLEASYHVATLDNDAPLIEQAAVAFADRIGLLV